jgi:hypothetical protein
LQTTALVFSSNIYNLDISVFRFEMMNHCKELCGQELEQDVLASEKKLIQQRLLLDSLRKEVTGPALNCNQY